MPSSLQTFTVAFSESIYTETSTVGVRKRGIDRLGPCS
jgi:hypothetical protein